MLSAAHCNNEMSISFISGVDNEGWFDPWLLLSAFKMKALSLGVNLLSGTAVGFQTSNSGQPDRLVFSSRAADMLRQVQTLHFRRCIDCGGPWSRDIARLAGIGTGSGQLAVDVPVEPR
jgi:FAD-dependent oxidoreductase domain-containing protein 1